MADAAEERRRKRRAWSARVFSGEGVHEDMEADALAEWAAMSATERLALAWELSLEQYGGDHDGSLQPRLPRSAYRVERR